MLAYAVRKRQLEQADGGEEAGAPRPPPSRLARRAATAASFGAAAALRQRESALFRPGRAVGVVTDGTAFSQVSLGEAEFVTVSIGRGFQVFECKHLRLVYLGPRLNEKVRALHCVGEVVLTALKADIVAWYKLTELGRFRGHTASASIMCNVGTGYLVSGSSEEVLVWKLSDVGVNTAGAEQGGECVLAPLGKLEIGDDVGTCTALCHMATYLHKVLVAGSAGGLAVWNVRTRECVHSFTAHRAVGKETSSITCLRPVPNVLDLVAIGFATGRICILHAREDRSVFEFEQAQGRITALSFRTGPSAPAHLVSGAPNGALVVWDLEKRRAHHVVENAHQGPIAAAQFLPLQSLLLTAGYDNAIRMWVFDTADGLPRLLQTRCGCPGPARWMSFYHGDDRELLVGGGRGEAGFVAKVSCIQAHQNVEYSQANLTKIPAAKRSFQVHHGHLLKLPPVVDLAFCEVRHYDWPAVVTAHDKVSSAMVWSAHNQVLSPLVLKPPTENCAVTAVAISKCGSYCAVGLENGSLHRFNLQSGLYRGQIPKPPEVEDEAKPTKTKKEVVQPATRAHLGRICGLATTFLGQVLSVGSHPKDCQLRVWMLSTHEAVASVPLSDSRLSSPSCLLLRAQGALVAISLDDGALVVADLYSKAVVRSFTCGAPAADVAFSAEGRWLAAALRDGGLRVFDLPTARCVDSFVFARPALSLCFSPSTAFLLTSHAKGNAIQVWTNKFLFDPHLSAPLLRPEPTDPIAIEEPGAPDPEEQGPESDAEETAKAEEKAEPIKMLEPLAPQLLTLSDVPPAKWMATLHLDIVKERNKPIEPPKPLPSAPFFLPSAHEGVNPTFVAPLDSKDDEKEELAAVDDAISRVLRGEQALGHSMPFQVMLRKGDFDGALKFLKAQTPSGVHLAIEELGPLATGDLRELQAGLEFFVHHLEKAHYADELQAYLSLFLQAHGEELAGRKDLRALCAKLCTLQERRWASLNVECQKARCFLGVLTHTQSQW